MAVNAQYRLCEETGTHRVAQVFRTRAECENHPDLVPGSLIWQEDDGTNVWYRCAIEEHFCERWTDATARLVGNTFPTLDAGAELYAGGFALVIGPAIIMWIGWNIVRAIRVATGER